MVLHVPTTHGRCDWSPVFMMCNYETWLALKKLKKIYEIRPRLVRMCGASGTVVKDSCLLRDRHENPRRTSAPSTSVEKVWKETQQLMEQSEHLVRVMTHVCSQQLSGVFRTVAKYSQGTVNARPFVKSSLCLGFITLETGIWECVFFALCYYVGYGSERSFFWKLGYIFVLNYSSPIRGGFYHLILRSAIKILFWMGSITPKKEILLTWVGVKISFCWVRDIGLSDVETYPPIYSTIVNVLYCL